MNNLSNYNESKLETLKETLACFAPAIIFVLILLFIGHALYSGHVQTSIERAQGQELIKTAQMDYPATVQDKEAIFSFTLEQNEKHHSDSLWLTCNLYLVDSETGDHNKANMVEQFGYVKNVDCIEAMQNMVKNLTEELNSY